MCVCLDVFNEVSTWLDRQAHLNDRFPQVINSHLSCLRATTPVTDLHVAISTHDNKLLQCHTATGAYTVRLVPCFPVALHCTQLNMLWNPILNQFIFDDMSLDAHQIY